MEQYGRASVDALGLSGRWLLILAVGASLVTNAIAEEKAAILRATAAIEAATPRAQDDPAHPSFHVTAPAQWINDPNGPIYFKGYYHLFYQLHPFSDGSGPKYWGHVRSRDLVKWEHLPIALAPSAELGEAEIWSGCCTLNGRGRPMIFYTSIAAGKSAGDHAEQWAALGDKDLIHWSKAGANPVLTEALHGERKVYDWRDPFVFREHGRTFLVTGGNLNRAKGGQAVVNIYEARNAELTRWEYRGILFQHPDARARTVECPNFFQVGKQWVLLVSPYGKVEYFVGDFDLATCRFQARTRGLVDWGPNFYAPNTMQLADGRRLVWGWVNGFPDGHGWNGCLSLPRQLRISSDGRLRQEPVPQLRHLRGRRMHWRDVVLTEKEQVLALPKTNTVEMMADIDLGTAKSALLELRSGSGNGQPIKIQLNRGEMSVQEVKAQLDSAGDTSRVTLHIFLDRSVLEVFINDTVSITKTVSPLEGELVLSAAGERGEARAKVIEAWPLKTIW